MSTLQEKGRDARNRSTPVFPVLWTALFFIKHSQVLTYTLPFKIKMQKALIGASMFSSEEEGSVETEGWCGSSGEVPAREGGTHTTRRGGGRLAAQAQSWDARITALCACTPGTNRHSVLRVLCLEALAASAYLQLTQMVYIPLWLWLVLLFLTWSFTGVIFIWIIKINSNE